jgi:hypothetical protein
MPVMLSAERALRDGVSGKKKRRKRHAGAMLVML